MPELNRQVVTRYFQEFWTNGNANIVDELCDDTVTIFYPMHGRMVGKTAAKEVIARFKQVSLKQNPRAGLPDMLTAATQPRHFQTFHFDCFLHFL